ncbi:MAG TPA: helix-turn-helix domain-containing protein [Ktedonobacteraceae bacterium]|nr:helix-turn-helix domain-containing protein [Ktedonobacteraceae bacterium]
MNQATRGPNALLRRQRELRGWSHERVAEELHTRFPGVAVTGKEVARWERGKRIPGPYYREKLCALYGVTAEALGFAVTPLPAATSSHDSSQDTLSYVPSKGGVLVPPSVVAQMAPLEEAEVRDWAAWFALKQVQILAMINLWSGRALFCEELQIRVDREISMFDELKPQDGDEAFRVSRRQAIVALAALPMAVLASAPQSVTTALLIEEFLPRCTASITACWHLLKGSEFSVVEHMVSAYLPTLVQLAQQPSRYQKTAARLATQGYRLKGIVALHQNNLQARENYCQRALSYSEIAEDPSLLVSALISLASTFYYWSDPIKASHIYQKALLYMEHIPPLQRSRLSVELAVVYAQRGQEQEALRYLKLAQQVYPGHPENDPSFLYAEFSPASLFLEEGLTFLALTQHYPDREYDQKAWDTFAQVEEQQSKSLVPARILFEITNQQAETALALRNQELFRTYLEKGIQGAHALNSKQRRREAVKAYKQAQIIWPHELRIKELAELFL